MRTTTRSAWRIRPTSASGLRRWLYLPAVLLWFGSQAHAQSVTEQAAAHVEAGRHAAAYALLAPQESERAGDPQFDLLLGIAAVETGRHTLAVFALERVLALQPDNARARAEIGRAYLALGESASAKRELQAVRGQNVPPEVARSLDRLLSAIDRAPTAPRPSFSGFVEAAVGRDTNVNSATSAGSIAIPGLIGDFTLTGDSRSRDAWFSSLAGGINARIPLSREWALVGGASGAGRFNGGESRFDTTAVDGNAGVAWTRGANRVTAALQGGIFEVDNDKLRDYTGLSLQWQHTHDARNQTTAFMQHVRLRYDGSNDVRDVNRNIYGVGHAHVLQGGKTMMFGSFYLGSETGRNDLPSGVNIAGNDVIGFRVGAQHTLDPRWLLFGALAHEARDYENPDPLFLRVRDDTLTTLSLGATYALTERWLLTPSVTLMRNDSSFSINDYRRGVAQFAVRRTFQEIAMPRIFRPVPLALAMAAAFPLAVNADSAARVEFTAGEVRAVAADGRSRPLTRGAQVGSGDTIDTGSGRAQMRFTDGALVSLQPQTQFRIDQYAFAGKPDEDRGFFNLLKGGLRTITGLVGKANRSNYKLTTSVATIGIRGTEFSVAYGNSVNVTTGDGAVDVCNGAGCLTVEDGQSAYVADQNTIPVIIEVKTDLPPPPPSNASGGVEPAVSNEVFLVGEERDDDGDLVSLDGLDPQGDLQSGDGYYVYGQYTEQYGGYGGLVTLTGVTTVIEGSALKSADNGDSGVLTAGTVAQSAQDGIIGWGRWASASCSGFSCDGDVIADLHYVTGRATPDLAALGGISATYSLSGATTPTTSGGAPGGAVSGTLLADFSSYTADLDLGVTVSAVTFNVSGSGSINSGTAAFSGSFDSCSGCGSTPNGSFHGFFAGPAAERAGVVYSFDSAIGGIDKVTGAAVFAKGGSNMGN